MSQQTCKNEGRADFKANIATYKFQIRKVDTPNLYAKFQIRRNTHWLGPAFWFIYLLLLLLLLLLFYKLYYDINKYFG